MQMMPRWVMWLMATIAVGVAVGFIALVATPHPGGDSGANPASTQVLKDYIDALRPPTTEGGRIVEQEMKPSLGEFERGEVDGNTFSARARGWQIGMQRVRDRIDQISVPPVIASAGPLFDAAIDDYISAARLFEQAGQAAAAQKDAAVQRAVDAARTADRAYDRAAAVVQRALRAAGLPPDSALPDPTPETSPS